jgi:hypothetical protein
VDIVLRMTLCYLIGTLEQGNGDIIVAVAGISRLSSGRLPFFRLDRAKTTA